MAKITLSMIVKNEERYLRECLESVKGIVDEIVIVDTGSTDDTLKIAHEFGARVFSFDWIDDFSAARNFALSKSSGDWILYLDADERLDEQSKEELRIKTKTAGKAGFYCTVINFDSVESRDNSFRYIRLFANSQGINFTGKIHEQIEDSLRKNDYQILQSGIVINHIGYNVSVGDKKKKAQRNLDILLREYKQNSSPYYEYQIAQSYNVLDDSVNALKYFQKAAAPGKLDRAYRAQSYCSMALISHANHKLPEAEKYISQSLELDNKQPFAHLVASKIFSRAGDFEKAEIECMEAYRLCLENANLPGDNAHEILVTPEEVIYYGLILALQNRSGNLFEFYKQALENVYRTKYPNHHKQHLLIIEKIIQNSALSDEEVGLLDKIINSTDLNFFIFILNNYKNRGMKISVLERLANRFEVNAEIKKSLAKAYGEAGKIDEAIEIIENNYKMQTEDPAFMFYLVSFYIKKGNFEKVNDLVISIEKNFKHIPEIVARVAVLKEKLNAFSKA